MRQRRFCSKDELDTDMRFGWKNLRSSGVHGWISVLRLMLCTTFYCGSACYREESQKICFRLVLVGARSPWRVEHVENSPKNYVSGRFWNFKLAKSLCSRKICAARNHASPWTIIWFVEKVPRRVILYASEAILLQRWAEHIYGFDVENSS